MSELRVRLAAAGDADAIARVVNAAYRPAPGAGGWTHEAGLVAGNRTDAAQVAALMARSTLLVGERNGCVVACIHLAIEGTEAHFGMLAVDPAAQGCGLGKTMMARAEEYAAARGASDYVLDVIGARVELAEFYRRRGYRHTGEWVEYPRDAGAGVPFGDSLAVQVMRKRADDTPRPR